MTTVLGMLAMFAMVACGAYGFKVRFDCSRSRLSCQRQGSRARGLVTIVNIDYQEQEVDEDEEDEEEVTLPICVSGME